MRGWSGRRPGQVSALLVRLKPRAIVRRRRAHRGRRDLKADSVHKVTRARRVATSASARRAVARGRSRTAAAASAHRVAAVIVADRAAGRVAAIVAGKVVAIVVGRAADPVGVAGRLGHHVVQHHGPAGRLPRRALQCAREGQSICRRL